MTGPAKDEVVYIPCPRCLGVIENVGRTVMRAFSRATEERDVEICGRCASDEALRESEEGWIVPVAEWPLVDDGEVRFGPLDAHFYVRGLDALVPFEGAGS
ncbi:hypothetical protein [uncultured Microbacterium sp.]|uniref:hypothetical protein n=1 Tax=uncultured Microbacterium sp. TaxID=191216 RepID=UPI0025ED20D0|nr:hypothetical protein [uncultured Microbacterium sp.]